jgi:hypothetical protein
MPGWPSRPSREKKRPHRTARHPGTQPRAAILFPRRERVAAGVRSSSCQWPWPLPGQSPSDRRRRLIAPSSARGRRRAVSGGLPLCARPILGDVGSLATSAAVRFGRENAARGGMSRRRTGHPAPDRPCPPRDRLDWRTARQPGAQGPAWIYTGKAPVRPCACHGLELQPAAGSHDEQMCRARCLLGQQQCRHAVKIGQPRHLARRFQRVGRDGDRVREWRGIRLRHASALFDQALSGSNTSDWWSETPAVTPSAAAQLALCGARAASPAA